jgi:hypothetical protein
MSLDTSLATLDLIQSGQSFADVMAESGQRVGRRRRFDPTYKTRLAEAAGMLARVYRGSRRAALEVQEAMAVGDFPLLFGDVLDRQLLANYAEWRSPWRSYLKVGTVTDFRTVKRFVVNGAEDMLPEVLPGAAYDADFVTEAVYSYSVRKYGKRMPFLFEDFINDDLGALRDMPQRLANAARRSEDFFATGLYVGTTGPHTSLFGVAAPLSNIITGNPPLTGPNLATGVGFFYNLRDGDGLPITIDAIHLVVPPALAITAMNIANAHTVEFREGAGSTNQTFIATNWLAGRLQVHVDPMIPYIATSNGNTSWFLFADQGSGRPVAEVGFLAGHETPEIWMKSPNARRVGGGEVNPMDGDFDHDGIQYRVRHIFGGGRFAPAAITDGAPTAVASNGSGT